MSKLPRFIAASFVVILLITSSDSFQLLDIRYLLDRLGFVDVIMPFGFTGPLKVEASERKPSTGPVYRLPQVPLEVEGYSPAPEGLELEQVHVYVRHGERTPVGVRLAGPPASIPEHWNMCKGARRFHYSAAGHSDTGNPSEPDSHDCKTPDSRTLVERKDGTASENECLLGELTDLGRQTTLSFGENLRKLYIHRLGFLPDQLADKRTVYFRTTNMPRTTESLHQIVDGLYPRRKRSAFAIPNILIRNGKDENLIGNTYSCKRLEFLQASFAQAAAKVYNSDLESLDGKISKYLNGNPIRVDGRPRASGVMDTIRASIAHGINVPLEFEDKEIVDRIERAVVNEWFADKTEEVRRLAMGRLLDDLSRKMSEKMKHGTSDPLKLLVHSTHDTAIAGLCSTLDVFDERWPAFTASITFELFKKAPIHKSSLSQSVLSTLGVQTPPEYYIRMRHQNQDMHLPICAPEGKHLEGRPEFCTFTAFQERVKELTPKDWDVECSPRRE